MEALTGQWSRAYATHPQDYELLQLLWWELKKQDSFNIHAKICACPPFTQNSSHSPQEFNTIIMIEVFKELRQISLKEKKACLHVHWVGLIFYCDWADIITMSCYDISTYLTCSEKELHWLHTKLSRVDCREASITYSSCISISRILNSFIGFTSSILFISREDNSAISCSTDWLGGSSL